MATNYEFLVSGRIDLARVEQQLEQMRQRYNTLDITVNLTNMDGIERRFNELTNTLRNNLQSVTGQLNTTLNNDFHSINNMRFGLADMNFSGEQIGEITRNLEEMDIAISRIRTTIDENGGITLNITGLQDLNTAISLTRRYNENGEFIEETNRRITQTFDDGARATREFNTTLGRAQAAMRNNGLQSSIDSLSAQYQRLLPNGEENAQIHAQLTIINNDLQLLDTLRQRMTDPTASEETIVNTYEHFTEVLTRTRNNINSVSAASRTMASSLQIATLDNKIDVWLTNNTRATKNFGTELQNLKNRLYQLQQSGNATVSNLKIIESEFNQIKIAAEMAGQTGQSFGTVFARAFKRVSNYISSAYIIYQAINSLKQMYQNVLQVDTALTGLYRVTNLSADGYSKLFNQMTESAQKYGATLKDIIDGTTTWVKLGFDTDTSAKLAEITTMYQHVTDLDVETATKNLVTAYKGFQKTLDSQYDTADKAITYVADIYDKLGNEYAVSAANVGDALSRSASSLQLAGNTIEQAAGMATGITEVIQDASKAGSTLNVVSLRLRGMKGELEELGEEVDENVESISKMQTHILNLTNGKVNIFDDNGNFKSTFEIMREIAEIYDELDDTKAADLLETISGKQRANAVGALISNWQQVESATEAAYNSAGTATKEQEKWMESMQGHLNQLQATWEVLSTSFLNSDALKVLIDLASKFLSLITGAVDTLGTVPTIMLAAFAALSFKNIGRIKMFILNYSGKMPIAIVFYLDINSLALHTMKYIVVNEFNTPVYITLFVNQGNISCASICGNNGTTDW